MPNLTDLEYLRLNRFQKALHKIGRFFAAIPRWFLSLFIAIWNKLKGFGIAIKNQVLDIILTFKNGSWKTRVSFFIMGFGNLARGQILRGLLFFIFQVVFIFYMVVSGGHWLSKFGTLGDVGSGRVYDPILDTYVLEAGDDSFKILLYGLLTIIFIIALVYTWRLNVKQNRIADEIIASGKKLKSGKDDIKSLTDDYFHKTLLALPVAGIVIFTVIPIIFMILVAFTNYDGAHDGYSNLFTWVGLDNFNELLALASNNNNLSYTFGEILSWTLMWAIFATFTNYFLGMFVAIMINKRGIHLKKLWRGILVLTIAIPQFVSLLYVSKLFANNGLVNGLLMDWGWISSPIQFWKDPTLARIMVIVVNIWIGIPYLMLIATGILMNIPKDMYESSRIDGANAFQQYSKITLPYMLFVTGPYLLTSFVNNINNFNVIYLLTWGQAVDNPLLTTSGGNATSVDLLITWLFKITTGATSNYKLAAVIGIMIFVVVAGISLIVYNLIPSSRNEDDYS
ncbi:MAG: sugar ABC transporter permease [Clostridia bacterium]|nr:sugar ABC transporter permease [Clostridia bacterium]